MAFTTKLQLEDGKFTQLTGTTLTLLGINEYTGVVNLSGATAVNTVGSTFNIDGSTFDTIIDAKLEVSLFDTYTGDTSTLLDGTINSANNGITKVGQNIVLGGTLTGDTTINTNSGFGVAIGRGTVAASGGDTFAFGNNAIASGSDSLAFGTNSLATGSSSIALGYGSCAIFDNSFSIGRYSYAEGNGAFALTQYGCAVGCGSIAIGYSARARLGYGSVAIGYFARTCFKGSTAIGYVPSANSLGSTAIGYKSSVPVNSPCSTAIGNNSIIFQNVTGATAMGSKAAINNNIGGIAIGGGYNGSLKYLTVCGDYAINISHNTAGQTNCHGVYANQSSIFGGIDANIASSSTGTTLIGGSAVKITGTSYIDTVVIPDNLALLATPSAGASEDVLTWNASTGKLNKVTQASIASQATSTTANNGITRIGDNFVLGGALTGDTCITTGGAYNFSVGTNNTMSGYDSAAFGASNTVSSTLGRGFAAGYSNTVSGSYATALGTLNFATGYQSFASGYRTSATTDSSFSIGDRTYASGNGSFAGGIASTFNKRVTASADSSFNHSENNGVQTNGHGALAANSVILGGLNHNIESGNTRAAIIGGNVVKLTGTTYIDHTAVANLAVMSAPSAGITAQDVLVRNPATGVINAVTQASIASQAASPTSNNGITKIGDNFVWGGTLTGATTIAGGTNGLILNDLGGIDIITSSDDLVLDAQNNSQAIIKSQSGTVAGDTFTDSIGFNLDFTNDIFKVVDNRAVPKGLEYLSDPSATMTDLSLVPKIYVDSVATGLDFKESVRVASSTGDTDVDLTGSTFVSGSTIDSVVVNDGDRVLIKNNDANQEQNGIYVYSASTSGFTRSDDADGSPASEVSAGMFCFVEEGTLNADTGWVLTTNDPIVVGTTNLVFGKFSSQGVITVGDGLSKTGNLIDIVLTSNSGLSFDGSSDLRIDSTFGGIGSTIASGVLDLNIENAVVTGSEINVQIATGGTNVLMVDSDDIATALGTPISSANNGLTKVGTNVVWGGTLTGDTTIDTDSGFGVVIGRGTAVASGTDAFAVGNNSIASGVNSISLGTSSCATGGSSMALGTNARACGTYSIAIGRYAYAQDSSAIAIGRYNCASGEKSLAIGYSSRVCSAGYGATAIGYGSNTQANKAVAIGYVSTSRSVYSTAVGVRAGVFTGSDCSLALGYRSYVRANSTGATAIGSRVDIDTNIGGIAIGAGVSGKYITTDGDYGINISHNTAAQTAFDGALAVQSAIFGGIDANIASTSTGTTLIGGNLVKITGTTYIDAVVLPNNLALLTAPSSGASGDTVLVRDGSTGVVKEVSQSDVASQAVVTTSNNGITRIGDNFVLGGTLTGNTAIESSTFTLAIGTGTISATGDTSIAFGKNTLAFGTYAFAEGCGSEACGFASHAEGRGSDALGNFAHAEGLSTRACGSASHSEGAQTCAVGNYSHSEGQLTRAIGNYSHAEGNITYACGNYSHAEGSRNCAVGVNSHTQGVRTIAVGYAAHAGGYGCQSGNRDIFACGAHSFNHSYNTIAQIAGDGANAPQSAILGGQDNNIASGNTGATIIGGNAIKLTGTTYVDFGAMDNLAVMSAPSAGITAQDVLVRNPATGVINAVTQASIASQATSTTANNGITRIGDNFVLGGTLTGNTHVDSANSFGIVLGNAASIATGASSMAIGYSSKACGNYSFASGQGGEAVGTGSHAEGQSTNAIGTYSHSEGSNSSACGNFSHAEGSSTHACGNYSHAEGNGSRAVGTYSHAEGDRTQSVGNYSHSEGGRTCAVGSFSHTGGYGCQTGSRDIFACGYASFNSSLNTLSQVAGHGANGCASAILGGIDHNIASGNTNAAIIGGNAIKLTGTTYIDHTAVDNLAIMSTPAVGVTSDSVLVRDSSTGIIKAVSGSELGDANNVYDITGITSATLTTAEYVVLVQTSGATQTVTLPAAPVDGQAYKVKDRGNALSNPITVAGNGNNIDGASTASINTDYGALEVVYSLDADEWFSLAFIN